MIFVSLADMVWNIREERFQSLEESIEVSLLNIHGK